MDDRGRGGRGVIDVLETGLLEMRWNDGMRLLGLDFFGCGSRLIFIVIVIALTSKVIGAFVLMGWAELERKEWLASDSAYHGRSDKR
jgi:hypothetical protein